MKSIPALLRKPQVLQLTGWSKNTLGNRVKEGEFPAPLRTGPRTVAWLESDVVAYVAARVAERQQRTDHQFDASSPSN